VKTLDSEHSEAGGRPVTLPELIDLLRCNLLMQTRHKSVMD
jgi:hypothetical protein